MVNKSSYAGLMVLLVKLGPKLLPLSIKLKEALLNLAKTAIGMKGAGAAASVGIYGYLFTWQMGVALVLFIGIHEYGHIWAMKHCGIKTRGMFFIPGFGAVAIAEERFRSARNEAFIAIMGPVFGFAFFVLPCMAYWAFTDSAMFAAFAVVGTFVNLINLLTILPLDGGRMLKSIVYSKNHGRSFVLAFGVSLGTAVVAGFVGFFLFVYMALIGFMEMFEEFGIGKQMRHFMVSLSRAAFGVGLFFVARYLFLGNWTFEENWGEDWLTISFSMVVVVGITFLLCMDILRDSGYIVLSPRGGMWMEKHTYLRRLARYPGRVLYELYTGFTELFSLRLSHIKPISDYEVMGLGAKSVYTVLFFGTVALHAAVLVYLSITPEGALMGNMLE